MILVLKQSLINIEYIYENILKMTSTDISLIYSCWVTYICKCCILVENLAHCCGKSNISPQKVSVLTEVLIAFIFAGGDMLVSGDDQGKIWVYDITKAPKAKSTSSKPPTQKATYVSEEYSSVRVIL